MDDLSVIKHTKTAIDMDLTNCAVEEAIRILKEKYFSKARVLVAPVSDSYIAGRLCQLYGIQFVGIPDELMKSDSWMVCGTLGAVYSPGA